MLSSLLKKRLIGKQNTYENEVNLITIKLYSRPLDLLFFCFKKRRDNTRLYGHFWSWQLAFFDACTKRGIVKKEGSFKKHSFSSILQFFNYPPICQEVAQSVGQENISLYLNKIRVYHLPQRDLILVNQDDSQRNLVRPRRLEARMSAKIGLQKGVHVHLRLFGDHPRHVFLLPLCHLSYPRKAIRYQIQRSGLLDVWQWVFPNSLCLCHAHVSQSQEKAFMDGFGAVVFGYWLLSDGSSPLVQISSTGFIIAIFNRP